MHVPMSLRVRTVAQGESEATHVPMSQLGADLCVGEGTRMIRNSLEVSGRFQGFLEVSRGMLPESSGRMGIKYRGVDGTRPV